MITAEQGADTAPGIIIREFFRSFHPPVIKHILQNWLEEAITKENSIYDEAQQRGLLLWLYKQLIEMLEAAYTMYNAQPGKKENKKQIGTSADTFK